MSRIWFQITLLFAPVALAQPAAPPQGPELGFSFDSASGTLLRIIGLPGAAHFGAPIEAVGRFSFAAISPGQDFALGLGSRDAGLYLIYLAGAPSTKAITGAAWAPLKITLSASGRAAVLSGPFSQIQLITGLPDSPSVSGPVDLSTFAGVVQAIGVSDSGVVLAAIGNQETPSQLYVISPGAGARLIGTAQSVAGIRFLPNSTSALIADRAARQIIIYQLSDSGATASIAAAEDDGITDPVAIDVSSGGRWAVVANGADTSIVRIDLTGATSPSSFACSCDPFQIARLAGDAVFQLGGLSNQPLWIFDGDSANPRIVFVPAPSEARPLGRKP